VILRSLTGRVVVGAVLVVTAVLVGGGLAIVTLTEQRDKRDADADLQRFAGDLTPGLAGVFGVTPPSQATPQSPLLLPPPRSAALVVLDRDGKPIFVRPSPRPPPGARPSGSPPPGVARALVDAFDQRGQSSTPAGQIVFVRALAMASGRRLILGAVPPTVPADVASRRRADGTRRGEAVAAVCGAYADRRDGRGGSPRAVDLCAGGASADDRDLDGRRRLVGGWAP
jgi:hypothetical protein